MKRVLLAAAAVFALASPAAADPVLGVWKTEVDDGNYAHVAMSNCGNKICGVIQQAYNSSGPWESDNEGKRLVWDMEPRGGGEYRSGSIWQPSTGKVYRSKMSLSGNTLRVSGCVGPICKKQTWTRVR